MTSNDPKLMQAEQREAGTLCAHCAVEINLDNPVAICKKCGAIHHEVCWQQRGACCSYECSGGKGSEAAATGAPLTITSTDLESVTPLASSSPTRNYEMPTDNKPERRWNRTALWAFALALLGIPLFGLITGLIAILVACIALVTHHENRRGMGLAVAAMLIGLFDVVGWAVALSNYWGSPQTAVSLSEMSIDPSSLDGLPEYLARAMRANVLIQIDAGLGRGAIGSGVVLKVKDDLAYIVTNRHVVDHNYSDMTTSAPLDLSDLARVMVMSVSQVSIPGIVEWVAPHGIDLAVISAPLSRGDIREAHWDLATIPHIGDEVFAVGNPHGLGWTHTSGDVSQIRKRSQGGFSYVVLQTSAPINPGNSGGGLYDDQGNLLGINTMTAEKRFAEGLSFSISLQTLVDLVPDRFKITGQNVEEPQQ